MNKTSIIIGMMAVVIAIGAIFYVKTMANASRTDTLTQTVPSVIPQESPITILSGNQDIPPSSQIKEFTIHGANFSFTPKAIQAKKGDTITITFINDEGFHDFVLDEFAIQTKQIKAGERETIRFIADKAGTFEFYCSVGTHRQMGMKGTLEITE